jgi:hypothetical protein
MHTPNQKGPILSRRSPYWWLSAAHLHYVLCQSINITYGYHGEGQYSSISADRSPLRVGRDKSMGDQRTDPTSLVQR